MANQAYWPNKKGLKKDFLGYSVYLGRSWDLTHGLGWHCQVFIGFTLGYGFHKSNKFTAYRMALNEAIKNKIKTL